MCSMVFTNNFKQHALTQNVTINVKKPLQNVTIIIYNVHTVGMDIQDIM